MKTEKVFIAGIKTWRTTIELKTVSREVIKVESWTKAGSVLLARRILKTL